MQLRSLSRPTLSTRFSHFLGHPLTPIQVWAAIPCVFPHQWVYGIDGKWLKRAGVVIIHRDITSKETLYWSFHASETYQAVFSDLDKLSLLLKNHLPKGAISDWKGAFVAGIKTFFGDIPHQRCLTHVTRTLKTLLPKGSPLPATQSLRAIVLKLISLSHGQEVAAWLWYLEVWEIFCGHLLKEKTVSLGGTKRKWWYTHGNLRRAWRIIHHQQEALFTHIYHSLPHSNNSLEGTISQATNKLHNHRGMKLPHQVAFLSWYFTFSRVRSTNDLKKLWATWKLGQ